ncbi:MAG: leucine-rich repeat domain-containing protein, partial [Clostridia bacterium]|nr:leucine-rich repeat domain-containing protein [Clostridia bacterium]
MKKNRFTLAFIAALMLMMSLFCISVSAAGFEYTESDTRKIIEGIVYDKCGTDENTYYSVRALATSYEKAQKLEKAEILTEIDGYPVTHIDFERISYPHKNFEYPLIKEFVIPDSVTYFSVFGLINLEEIVIPDNVTELGQSAFWNMKKIEEITLHEGITVIPESAFSGCKSLKKVEFKGEITELGEGAFSGCENLVTVTLPKTITEIKDHTFSKCGKLREVI